LSGRKAQDRPNCDKKINQRLELVDDVCGRTYHDEWSNQPVHDNTEADLDPQGAMAECQMQRFELYFAEDWVHHYQQANCYRN
jgi:hypothetical protein